MTDADDRLKALFAMDEPPARDPAFSATVMAEIARRRFLTEMGLLAGATVLGGMVLWILWPTLTPVIETLAQGLVPVLSCLTLAVGATMLLDGRVTAAFGLKHD